MTERQSAENGARPLLDALEDASRDLGEVPEWARPGRVFPPEVSEREEALRALALEDGYTKDDF